MKTLNLTELEQIKGGVFGWTVIGISAIIVFLAGVFEGITNPNPCQR